MTYFDFGFLKATHMTKMTSPGSKTDTLELVCHLSKIFKKIFFLSNAHLLHVCLFRIIVAVFVHFWLVPSPHFDPGIDQD